MSQTLDQKALDLIEAERKRQVDVEGWTPEHDDTHGRGEMLQAALLYRAHARGEPLAFRPDGAPIGWPWDSNWWKPKDPLSDLVRAGALCLAEADRARRAAPAIRPSREAYDPGLPASLKLALIIGDINIVLAALPVVASAKAGDLQRLIKAGNMLSFAAQTTGGTAGRDDGLVAAIEVWSDARDAMLATPKSPMGEGTVGVAAWCAVLASEAAFAWAINHGQSEHDASEAAEAVREHVEANAGSPSLQGNGK